MNAESQRIARRDKKTFISDQCKEIEENNRMGKTRDLFKKTIDTNGIFHAKMGTIKDRNGMDLTEQQIIKKMGQEYTEELYKKDLHDPDNHDGVITHSESDILECEVKVFLICNLEMICHMLGWRWMGLGECLQKINCVGVLNFTSLISHQSEWLRSKSLQAINAGSQPF